MDKRNKVSSKDVAREAGVSQATVSYVLNNTKNIKIRPETRQTVLDAAKRLNYHPSHIARGMKLKKSMTVGIITDRSVTNYNFMKTLEGIKDGLQQHNYAITLLFNKPDDRLNSEMLEYYNTYRLDGIIFSFSLVDDQTKDELNERGIPYVIVDSHATGKGAHEVGTDHLDHLPALAASFKLKGAVRLAYVGPLWKHKIDPRLEAFDQAIDSNDLYNSGCFLCPFNDEQITKTIKELLDREDRPEGILAGNPRYGFYVLKLAARIGLKVPEDLMVASLGNSNYHELCHPSMTAVELPLYDMGYHGATILVDLMNDKVTEDLTVLPSEIVMRESL